MKNCLISPPFCKKFQLLICIAFDRRLAFQLCNGFLSNMEAGDVNAQSNFKHGIQM